MSNSKKIILLVGIVCTISILATINLIRQHHDNMLSISTDKAATSGQPGNFGSAVKDSATKNESRPSPSAQTMTPSTPSSPKESAAPLIAGNTNHPAGESNQALNESQSASASTTATPSTKADLTAHGSDANHERDHATTSQGTTPSETSPKADSKRANIKTVSKSKLSFPGIDQHAGLVMVSGVRNTPGQSDDQISVSLTLTEGNEEVTGFVWVIGEYMQRGTTGIMYMPSHEDLKINTEGFPQHPQTGVKFSMRHNTEKRFTIKRPGFDGEELIAIRVGVVDKKTGHLHMARVLTKQVPKAKSQQRAKVELP